MSDDNSVVIVSACRTAIGTIMGSLRNMPAHDLGGTAIKASLHQIKLEPDCVSEIILGQTLTAGQGQNPARLAAFKAGVPVTVPAYGVNMLCGSGLKAVYLAYQAIKSDEATIVVAGGQESMSQAHHTSYMRNGTKYGNTMLKDSILCDGLTDPTLKMHMGDTAEALAQKYKISREQQDEFAVLSQQKTDDAMRNGHFAREIIPLIVRGKKDLIFREDEYPRPSTTVEILSKLSTVFSGPDNERTVTAGNSSGLNDGAAALVLCKKATATARNLTPLVTIVAFGQTGLEPISMGLGPIEAIKLVLKKADWKIDDVDLFELNEAFAVQSIIVVDQLNIPMEKVNVCGGAIALGHPIGCSGARVLVTLIYNMIRLDKKKGIAALCVGGGMGIAIAVQRE
ncbi:Acetyl-CoA acetyltransferase 2 [Carabus blaptoides fortunei]